MRSHILVFASTLLPFIQPAFAASTKADPTPDTTGTLYDYLVMNVCTDAAGHITDEDPLHCPANRQRDLRPGDSVPYFHADYPSASDTKPCDTLGFSRRYAFPLGLDGSDQTGTSYPVLIGWDDYPPSEHQCVWGRFDQRDSVTVLTIAQGFGVILGGLHHGKYHVSLGSGYADPAVSGVARFSKTWAFPEHIPPMNGIGTDIFFKKTQLAGTSAAELAAFPAHDSATSFARTIEWWKRMMFVYGPAAHPTQALDSLIQFGFAKSNAAGDAPGESKGSEHLYLTKELGYVTRWEDWHREDSKDVIAVANRAYDNMNCGMPADIEGKISPHLTMGPVIDDAKQHVYRQTLTVTDDKSATSVSHIWFLAGCHDYTNVHAQPPMNPLSEVNAQAIGQDFLNLFGVAAR